MNYLGKNVFIQTVTLYFTGKVVDETKKHYLLENAAWIADTGRFADALQEGVFSEVEPYPNPVTVMKSAIVSMIEIGDLPTKQK